jgi:hypothetical protein
VTGTSDRDEDQRLAGVEAAEIRAASHKENVDDAYQALGRYVANFSYLILVMRSLLGRRLQFQPRPEIRLADLQRRNEDSEILSMVFGEATAMQIARSFFGACDVAGHFDDPERAVASHLKKLVVKEIERRNDFAHGDWHVGAAEGGVSVGTVGGPPPAAPEPPSGTQPPLLARNKPGRNGGAQSAQFISTTTLSKAADEVNALAFTVYEFGELALRLSTTDEFRVGDIFLVRGPKSARALKREGPRANERRLYY